MAQQSPDAPFARGDWATTMDVAEPLLVCSAQLHMRNKYIHTPLAPGLGWATRDNFETPTSSSQPLDGSGAVPLPSHVAAVVG